MGEAGSGPEQYVTVEAPLKIQPGQNIYEQPPFNLVLAHTALAVDLTAEQLRVLATKVAKYADRLAFTGELRGQNGSGTFFAEKAMAELGSHLKPYDTTVQGRLIPTKPGIQATRTLLRDLSPYPYWFEYVNRFATGGMIKADGGWNEGAHAEPIDSYTVYAQRQLERNRALDEASFKSTMAEIFPQDSRGRSTSIVISDKLVQKGVTTLTTHRKP